MAMVLPTSSRVMLLVVPTIRFTLRSVKLLIELPACSKNVQKTMEKNVKISTTYMRWRAIRWSRSVSKTR